MEVIASITLVSFTAFLIISFASVLLPYNNLFSLKKRVEPKRETKRQLKKKDISIW